MDHPIAPALQPQPPSFHGSTAEGLGMGARSKWPPFGAVSPDSPSRKAAQISN